MRIVTWVEGLGAEQSRDRGKLPPRAAVIAGDGIIDIDPEVDPFSPPVTIQEEKCPTRADQDVVRRVIGRKDHLGRLVHGPPDWFACYQHRVEQRAGRSGLAGHHGCGVGSKHYIDGHKQQSTRCFAPQAARNGDLVFPGGEHHRLAAIGRPPEGGQQIVVEVLERGQTSCRQQLQV